MNEQRLEAGEMSLIDLRRVVSDPVKLILDDSSWQAVDRSRRVVQDKIAAGAVTYGVNTGFGRLARSHIADDQLEILQSRLLQSHAAGVGEPLDEATVRLILVLKINSLARGYSGVRPEVLRHLLAFLEHELYPVIPCQGSVGASGDLAPLAHLSLPLIGLGEVFLGGQRLKGAEALARCGLEPLKLHAKEGLALLNGTQVSTALALRGLFEAEQVAGAALCAGALSVDAVKASRVPFDARIHLARGQHGQIAAAAILRRLLRASEIEGSHVGCGRVQDPYSFRCHAAGSRGRAATRCSTTPRRSWPIEFNAASDNPLIFPDEGDVLSGGNFHAEPVALAADNLALAIAEIGALSERRIALLVDLP